MEHNIKIGTIQKAILRILDNTAIVTVAMVTSGPLAVNILKTIRREQRKRAQAQVFRSILALKRERLISLKEYKGEQCMILTDQGKRKVLRYQLETLILPMREKWDGKWRMILFDIPERFGKARRALSTKLKDMGALPLQKSVFIFPFPCQNEIDFITEFFQVSPYVRYAEAGMVEGAENLKRYFKL